MSDGAIQLANKSPFQSDQMRAFIGQPGKSGGQWWENRPGKPYNPSGSFWIMVLLAAVFLQSFGNGVLADGIVMPKRKYDGSLEEKSQQAILIFHTRPDGVDQRPKTVQDLILSIEVHGSAREFAWIIPFPNEPETFKEDGKLFEELFNYVQHQQARRYTKKKDTKSNEAAGSAQGNEVEVISRKVVGSYEVTVVRENTAGTLNNWLKENEYRELSNADDVIEFYREKDYVFACIKYTAESLEQEGKMNSHPLRFRFETGGTDALYFPMKMTGLQSEPFDVNLYVFRPSWVNGDLNKFGHRHRGMTLTYRDWDTSKCKPNAGKTWSDPANDPFLKGTEKVIPTVRQLFQQLYPGERFYLTQIQGRALEPESVRNWSDDLWLFPYYTNRSLVPFDARAGQVASTAWPNESQWIDGQPPREKAGIRSVALIVAALAAVALLLVVPAMVRKISHG